MRRQRMTVVRVLLAGVLLVGAVRTGGQQADRRDEPPPVAMTNSQPAVSFAVSPDTLVSTPPVLALSFPKVVNPANTAFSVFAYFSYRPGDRTGAAPVKILLGSASLYPADRPGGFRLRASAAFAKLKTAKATDVRLVLEMKRIHPAQPWSHVEVTVAPPQWLGENYQH